MNEIVLTVDPKQCTRCKECKPRTEFHRASRSKDGLHSYCKECVRLWNKARKDSGERQTYLLARKYGLTLQEYKKLLERSGGLCDICGEACKPNVDHNHNTGQARGILCRACNTALGLFKESPRTLLAAVRYLEREQDTPEFTSEDNFLDSAYTRQVYV